MGCCRGLAVVLHYAAFLCEKYIILCLLFSAEQDIH